MSRDRCMNGKRPILIHCSSGDRASAGFAAMLITYYGYSNKEAVDFATITSRCRTRNSSPG